MADLIVNASPELVPVLANHRFDEVALTRYLAQRLPDFADGCVVRQFQGGQSNPTFHIETKHDAYVLRKKPGGALLPSAHAVDREYRILKALSSTDVPVPHVRLLCEDPEVIGTIFYVMNYLPDRIYIDRAMPGVDAAHRRATFQDMASVLARLHRLQPESVGLGDFGRSGNYIGRQIERWTRQYQAARLEPEPAMDRLMAWLVAHPAVADETTIAHGDYRLGNLIVHPTEPRVIAVLDWELSTLGHPLADLAYCCLPWRLPPDLQGLVGLDVPGLPTEAEFVASYCAEVGRAVPESMGFFIVFSLFRWAAIVAGVYRRALDGNAADARAEEAGTKFRKLARMGQEIVDAA
jgi:aminoglycoside phosphotransferase (APT) family kinase protein